MPNDLSSELYFDRLTAARNKNARPIPMRDPSEISPIEQLFRTLQSRGSERSQRGEALGQLEAMDAVHLSPYLKRLGDLGAALPADDEQKRMVRLIRQTGVASDKKALAAEAIGLIGRVDAAKSKEVQIMTRAAVKLLTTKPRSQRHRAARPL